MSRCVLPTVTRPSTFKDFLSAVVFHYQDPIDDCAPVIPPQLPTKTNVHANYFSVNSVDLPHPIKTNTHANYFSVNSVDLPHPITDFLSFAPPKAASKNLKGTQLYLLFSTSLEVS
mmetsp:Transcript_19819/g.26900  ORF Transcript_19819/g.26900 Transcript_19819/m.26900 type:complete len:116 (-) Transcript_19819:789-1136(-)